MFARIMITNDSLHPAEKWADVAADDIIEIGSQSPEALIREAQEFRRKIHEVFTHHHQLMMDYEQESVNDGNYHMELPYESNTQAERVADEIIQLARGTSFEKHFNQEHVRQHIINVCNHYFGSAMQMIRHHHHTSHVLAGNEPLDGAPEEAHEMFKAMQNKKK